MVRSTSIALVCCCSLAIPAAAAQRRAAATAGDQKVPVTISLQVGGESYQFNGQAACRHAPKASIYNTLAQQWTVEQMEGPRSVHLTFWRPMAGSGDMFSLSVSVRAQSYTVNTVKTSGGGTPQGSGDVKLAASGGGGTFTVNAAAGNGTRIAGTIKCDAFSAAVAEGGD